MSPSANRHAAIVGAGLSGLTAAYRLKEAGWQVSVFEASDHAGGRVQTVSRDGFLMDTGASALADSYKSYIKLADELGLGGELVPTSPSVGIYRDGRLHQLRLDRLLSAGFSTRVLSWNAKLRMARLVFDIVLAKLRGQLDYADMRRAAPLDTESAGDYARRALGPEANDYFCSPVVRTMLIADPDKISKVELLSGVANIFTAKILTLRGGQGRLPQLLAEHVLPRFRHAVQQVQEHADGVRVTYLDADGASHAEHFDACVVGCPLPQAMQICTDKHALLAPLNLDLQYTQCITVALALKRPPASPAFLVQMPTCEDAEIALMFLDHNKSIDRVPPGRGLIDCHWETAAASRMMQHSDEDIIARTFASVLRVFPEVEEPLLFGHVTRWPQALPLTRPGAYRLIGDFNAALDQHSRIQFASDYMSAAGQNTAVELGNRAARNLAALPI